MSISVSKRAESHLARYLSQDEQAVAVRIAVTTTGCSGYAYEVSLANEVATNDKTMHVAGIDFVIDDKSYPFLKGVELDYVQEGLGHKLVFQNPNASGSCGCGESFTV